MMKKTTIIMIIVAIVVVAAPNWAGGNLKFSRRPGIAELSYLLNKLRRYTHFISRFAVFMQQSGH